MVKRALMTLVALLVLAPAAQAAGNAIGVVDFQALQKTPFAQKAEARLQAAQGAYQRELQARSARLDEAQRRKVSADELAKMRQQFEKELAALRTKGEREVVDASEALKRDVDKAVKVVAEQRKLEFVVDKRAVLFGGTDITSEVEKQLVAQDK